MDTRLATRRLINRLQTALHSPAFAVIAGLLMLLAASVIACAPAAYANLSEARRATGFAPR